MCAPGTDCGSRVIESCMKIIAETKRGTKQNASRNLVPPPALLSLAQLGADRPALQLYFLTASSCGGAGRACTYFEKALSLMVLTWLNASKPNDGRHDTHLHCYMQ
jgi:hypothetical protein